jgi:hypothetical protein
MDRRGNNPGVPRTLAASSRRKIVKLGIVILLSLSLAVCVVVFGPKIINSSHPPEQKHAVAQSPAVPITPAQSHMTPKEYRVGKAYVLMQHKDPKTGDLITQRVTIDDMLLMQDAALVAKDAALYKKIDSKLLELGDQVVPELGAILLCEDNPELLAAAARMLGKIGTDKAISQLLVYLKERDLTSLNSQSVAINVIDAIANSKNRSANATLTEIFTDGRTPEDKAEAMRILGATAKDDKWFNERVTAISRDEKESDVLRARAICLLVPAGDAEAANIGMKIYFSVKDPFAKQEIVWALDHGKVAAAKDFFAKVCMEESDVSILMNALPAWFRSRKGDDPKGLVEFLRAVYERKVDDEITREVVSCLGAIGGKESQALLEKIASEGETQAIKDYARQVAESAGKDATGAKNSAATAPASSSGSDAPKADGNAPHN